MLLVPTRVPSRSVLELPTVVLQRLRRSHALVAGSASVSMKGPPARVGQSQLSCLRDVGAVAGLNLTAEQHTPLGVRPHHGLYCVLLDLVGDKFVPVLAACGWVASDLRTVDDPGPPLDAQVLNDLGQGTQPDVPRNGAARRASWDRTSLDGAGDDGEVYAESAGPHVVSGARPQTHQGGRQPVDEIDFLPLLKEGDSYGSRCRGFCFVADCPPGVFR